MIKRSNINIPLEYSPTKYLSYVAKALHIKPEMLQSVTLLRRSIDVRHKQNPHYCCTFLIEAKTEKIEADILKKDAGCTKYVPKNYQWPTATKSVCPRPVIVGAGPAGLFAALALCRAGLKPIIIEQGEPVEKRTKTVAAFWNKAAVNPHSNVQFGEGGAGTFSDGKLNTGIKDFRIQTVLKTFVEFGADKDILIDAKPHIGTDVLRKVVQNIRKEIERLGGEYRFETEMLAPVIKNGNICAIQCRKDGQEYTLNTDYLILAIGNAARPLFKTLYNCQINMQPKAFAIGGRIEHLQSNLNKNQYGENYSKLLPPCDYKLAAHPNERGVYTFCMCPGGVVVNAADCENHYVTNGMSYKSRDGKNANSAILVGVVPEDFGNEVLGGIALQEKIEQAAFALTGGKGVPVQTVGSFLYGEENKITDVLPTVLPDYVLSDLTAVFPPYITETLRQGLKLFENKIHGFAAKSAVLTAPETRSSSPVRILRGENFETNIRGIFPCGEGAGYAGGITSSAVDGLRCAENIISLINGETNEQNFS